MISLQLLVLFETASKVLLLLVPKEDSKRMFFSILWLILRSGPTCNNSKRILLLATFDVSLCFAQKMIELTKNIPGLNRPLDSVVSLPVMA